MKKKIWFYLFILQAFIIIIMVSISLWSSFSIPKFENANLKEYLAENEDMNYLPDAGYIPDAKTAKIIGSQIIDKMTGKSGIGLSEIVIEYDEENRLWLVCKNYFPRNGGIVVFEQDSGKIIKAFMTK